MNIPITFAGLKAPPNIVKSTYAAARFKPTTDAVAIKLWLRLIAVRIITTIVVKATIITGAKGISSENDIVKFMTYCISTFSS